MATSSRMTAPVSANSTGPWKQYLIINNVQKVKNIKNMLISASAFGVSEIFVVGQKKFSLEEHEALLQMLSCPVTRMASLAECQAHCKANNIRIAGVEILSSARSLLEMPFSGHTAFMMGNEGSGMNTTQIAVCDDFIYIPQYGGGTASLNVSVAASIIMQTFAVWAGIPTATPQATAPL
ncbi:TPA: hypothetical protein N0F65_007882 [Lagenidium giganteum]|uniref:tRNA/rRNA methyltransferase SpoU type domain-containing protein n=1 Tax=Lagenidium giganteum TaxID=4803 RepID=A0AAV2YYU3_9STRA|nr:TPA: hypothetical protein N0F65_007882 [Lagenidium giganteum]